MIDVFVLERFIVLPEEFVLGKEHNLETSMHTCDSWKVGSGLPASKKTAEDDQVKSKE